MIWWMVDNANLLYLLLALVALVLGVIAWQSRRGKYLIFLGIALALIGLVWLLTRLVVTDRGQIEGNLRSMAQAALDRKPDRILPYLARDFDYHGTKRDEVARRVAQTADHYKVFNYHIWDFTVDELNRNQRQAKASFRLRVNYGNDNLFMGLCRCVFVLEGEKWCIQNIQVFNPVADTNSPITIPLH